MPESLTISELDTLLAQNGLPGNTPVLVRLSDGSSDSTYEIARVQAVRKLQSPRMLAAGQGPEFVVEIVIARPASHRPGGTHGVAM